MDDYNADGFENEDEVQQISPQDSGGGSDELQEASLLTESAYNVSFISAASDEIENNLLLNNSISSQTALPSIYSHKSTGSMISNSSSKQLRRLSHNEQQKLHIGRRISLHIQTIRKARQAREIAMQPPPEPVPEKKPVARMRASRSPSSPLQKPVPEVKSEAPDVSTMSLLVEPSKQKHPHERPKLLINYIQSEPSVSPAASPKQLLPELGKLKRMESHRTIKKMNSTRRLDVTVPSTFGGVNSISMNSFRRSFRNSISGLSAVDLAGEREKYKFESLLRWNFAIPFDTRNCIVEISMACDVYNENFYYSVTSSTPPYRKFSSGTMPIDLAFDLTHRISSSTSTDEDLYAMRSLFHNLFQQADTDHSGSLSFFEIQTIVEKINIGLSPQEVGLIVASADVDASGEVDYNEFVPLAVDMIHNMRTKSKAKQKVNDIPESITELVLKSIPVDELNNIAAICMQYLEAVDVNKIGAVSAAFIRSRLHNATVGLTSNEISMICSSLPRDSCGRCIYHNLKEVLFEVRFISLKNIIYESQGTELQKYLMDMCRDIERRHMETSRVDSYQVAMGSIPLKLLITALMESERLGLSRLQTMMICSEANVIDGMVNIHQFVPMAVKMIELMFDPESIRTRAQLIANTDLSPEALLEGESPELFERRIELLFKTHNADGSGELDLQQFYNCIDSMNLNLTKSEILTLIATADVDHSGTVSFSEFATFLHDNLLHLVREKALRSLQRSSSLMYDPLAESKTSFDDEIKAMLSTADPSNTGYIDYDTLCTLLKSVAGESDVLFDLMIAEVDVSNGFILKYEDLVYSISRVMEVFLKDRVLKDSRGSEKRMDIKASVLAHRLFNDQLEATCHYLADRLGGIISSDSAKDDMFRNMSLLLKDPNTGIARTESNLLLMKLGTQQNTTDTNSLQDLCTSEHIRSLLFRSHKLSILRSLVYRVDKEELSSAIGSKFLAEAKSLQKFYEKDPPVLIPICSCIRIFESSIYFINLNRPLIFSIIYWSQDCIQENMMHRKSFASFAASMIYKMTTSEYLESRAYVMENAGLDDMEIMDGLTAQALLTYLSQSCRAIADAHGEIFLDTFRAVLKETPKLHLTQKEVLIFEANFVQPNATKIRWEPLLPWAYRTLLNIRKECKIGRRIGLAALQCIRDGKVKEAFKQSLVDVAEHLLGLVKLQNKSGIVMATFPDAEKYFSSMAEDNSSVGKKKVVTTFHEKTLTLQRHPTLTSVQVHLNASMESLGLEHPTYLKLSVDRVGGDSILIFKDLSFRIPSIAEMDDEVSQAFCFNIIENIQAVYDSKLNILNLELKQHTGPHF